MQKAILNEFDRVAFRKTLYTNLSQLQADLDAYVAHYNSEQPHQGRLCYGKTADHVHRQRSTGAGENAHRVAAPDTTTQPTTVSSSLVFHTFTLVAA